MGNKRVTRYANGGSVLAMADRLVSKTRAADYGNIEDNSNKAIGAYYALKGTHKILGPTDHCLYMILYKLGRECTKHKRDNLIDGPGYFKLWDQILGGV